MKQILAFVPAFILVLVGALLADLTNLCWTATACTTLGLCAGFGAIALLDF